MVVKRKTKQQEQVPEELNAHFAKAKEALLQHPINYKALSEVADNFAVMLPSGTKMLSPGNTHLKGPLVRLAEVLATNEAYIPKAYELFNKATTISHGPISDEKAIEGVFQCAVRLRSPAERVAALKNYLSIYYGDQRAMAAILNEAPLLPTAAESIAAYKFVAVRTKNTLDHLSIGRRSELKYENIHIAAIGINNYAEQLTAEADRANAFWDVFSFVDRDDTKPREDALAGTFKYIHFISDVFRRLDILFEISIRSENETRKQEAAKLYFEEADNLPSPRDRVNAYTKAFDESELADESIDGLVKNVKLLPTPEERVDALAPHTTYCMRQRSRESMQKIVAGILEDLEKVPNAIRRTEVCLDAIRYASETQKAALLEIILDDLDKHTDASKRIEISKEALEHADEQQSDRLFDGLFKDIPLLPNPSDQIEAYVDLRFSTESAEKKALLFRAALHSAALFQTPEERAKAFFKLAQGGYSAFNENLRKEAYPHYFANIESISNVHKCLETLRQNWGCSGNSDEFMQQIADLYMEKVEGLPSAGMKLQAYDSVIYIPKAVNKWQELANLVNPPTKIQSGKFVRWIRSQTFESTGP